MSGFDIGQEEKLKDDVDFDVLLDALLSVLRKEVEIYEELQSIIADESSVLRRPSLELLSDSNAQKETCILKARVLEEVRVNIVKRIAWRLGISESEVTLTLLASYADDNRAADLQEKQGRLTSLLREISEANEKNKGLLDFSLSYVRSSMNFVNHLLSAGAGYESTGQLKSGGMHGRVVNREG